MTQRISFQEANKGLLDGLLKSELYLKKSSLDPILQELIKYRVSQINSCGYCLDMHHKEAIAMGETQLRLHSLAAWRECPYYTEPERAVLAFAEALTNANTQHIGDDVYDPLTAFFSKAEIADITLAITQINTWNRINRAFATVPGHYQLGQH